MTPIHLPTELVPCTCNHQGVQAVPVTAALGRLGAPASMDWHFSDQAECARAAPPPAAPPGQCHPQNTQPWARAGPRCCPSLLPSFSSLCLSRDSGAAEARWAGWAAGPHFGRLSPQSGGTTEQGARGRRP